MGKGIVLVGAVVVAAGGAGAYVYMADSPFARSTRAAIAKWGLGGDTAAEVAKTERESRFRKSKRHKPAPPAKKPAAKPDAGGAEDVGVKPAAPTTPEAEPPKGEDWGSMESGADKAAKQREADGRLTAALEAAQKAYRKLQLDAAVALRESISDLASSGLRAQAEALLAKMDLADRLTAGIEKNELADHKGVVEVTLISDRTREGRLVSQSGGSITIEGDFGIKSTFTRDQYKSFRKLTPTERRARLEAEVTERRTKKSEPTGLDVFKLAEWCVENGLPGKAVEFLEEASGLDGNLVATVREDRAARLYRHWMWLRLRKDRRAATYAERITKEFGDTKYAGELASTVEEAERELKQFRRPAPAVVEAPQPGPGKEEPGNGGTEEPERPVRPAPAGGNVSQAEKDGDAALKKAEAFAEGAQPSKPDSAKAAKRAIEWYKKAMALYEQAYNAASGGDQERIEEKIAEAGEGLYWTKKMARLW